MKPTQSYRPRPVDTRQVILPPEIEELRELLAKNTHEVWARTRIEQGWTYGPTRDDASKKHPCLVPYEELPEAEKEYDRQTALETLRLILALGYRIQRAEG
jgi:hypothetical protein